MTREHRREPGVVHGIALSDQTFHQAGDLVDLPDQQEAGEKLTRLAGSPVKRHRNTLRIKKSGYCRRAIRCMRPCRT